jgi:hypothetical protein
MAGLYEHPGIGFLEVCLEGDVLKINLYGTRGELEHAGMNAYTIESLSRDSGRLDLHYAQGKVDFHTDLEGNVTGLRLTRPDWFERRLRFERRTKADGPPSPARRDPGQRQSPEATKAPQ